MVGFDPHRKQELSSTEHGVAGAISGVVSRSVLQPIDVIKIRFQLQIEPISQSKSGKYHGVKQAGLKILKEEGIAALWKGHVPAQFLSVTFGVVQFVTFEFLTKRVWFHLPDDFTFERRPFTHFICGALSGCTATVVCQPFDVLRTRLVGQGEPKVYNSIAHACSTIARKEGVTAFWKGLIPTLVQIAPQTGFAFGFFTIFTSIFTRLKPQKESKFIGIAESFICGSLSGVTSKILVYPFDLTKKRLQIQGFEEARVKFGSTRKYSGMFDCLLSVSKEEGYRGLYKGLTPSLLKSALSFGLTFFVYEQACSFLTHITYDS